MGGFTDRRDRFKGVIRKMGVFTDGGYHLVGFIREMGRLTDRRERFEEVIRKMGVFADGGYHLVGFVREKGGFADRGIPESNNPKSNNLRVWNSATRNPAIPESNPKSLSDSVFLQDLDDRFSDRFSPEGVAVVGRMDAVD